MILVLQEKWYEQEKLSYWCQDFFSSYLHRGSITILYTTKHFAAESRPGIPLQSSIPFLIAGRHMCTYFSVSSSPNIKGCRCKGVCLLRFPTKLAEHRLLFIAQPSFLESSWLFWFPLILIRFFLINTLFFFCIIFLWFFLALIWSEKACSCSNTFSMWHVKDCQVHSPGFAEHETYVFSRAWLKYDFRMNSKRAIKYTFHVLF